jgi:hypothetical protein
MAATPVWLVIGLATILISPSRGVSQEPVAACPDHTASCCRPWNFRVIPYMWAFGLEGDLTVRRVTAPVDLSIGKMLDIFVNELNFAAIGQIEASNGRVGMIFNGIYADISPGKEVRRLDFSSDFRMSLLDWTATCELPGVAEALPLPCGSRLEALAGVRYYYLSAGITVTGPRGNSATGSGTEEWLDPIIGTRLRVPLCGCLTAQVRGDIGGFDIGDASRFSWNIEAMLEYRCSSRCSLLAGYRWLDVDYERGSGRNQFGFDMNMNGPVIGLTFDF